MEVRRGAAADIVPRVLTRALPAVVGDSVLGFTWRQNDLDSAFVYVPATRRLTMLALPGDADRWFTNPAFSPDGRHLAYVAYEEGAARGVVRVGTTGPVVVRTPPVPVPAGDGWINGVRWLDAGRVDILVDVGEPGRHRFRIDLATGAATSDTLPPAPRSSGIR